MDNFGLGEFFLLAVMALLFFGPERLPQIGAQLGRWIASLTQCSKAFMTGWSEEAIAIQDAVKEVQGIRDEIVAARAEIANTFDTARGDIRPYTGVPANTTPSWRTLVEKAKPA